MNRRELLIKAAPLAMVPFVKVSIKGHELDAIEAKPRKFLIFFDDSTIDVQSFIGTEIPGWEGLDALFVPVRLRRGQSVQQAIQLVEQFDS